ncbi:nitronate monooxygenase [Corynebacterium pseudodiphtheriticum]|uniref:nitronate monooxygenase n=1 Tax=Corynebacterium pseudodiphtheriticum TaxID=37637 RepID=UPI00234D4CA5|nr:nitronate monooxygenase [Corynebacterium pseudodiphtheriticum]MDC7067521.1 nitronate monooxygenase [Corynebacterium pseudodiphtheriticum]MDC7083587.1 nitronate monooxygenase [Corynebacterium pseudodiphtheriticum]MDC7085437.1 nitronate monooxygenase [Corynebacterium pseudodiphtheriticum]
MSEVLRQLESRILIAPMAGGPSTPRLVNAAAKAGSFGFLAFGTTSVDHAQYMLAGMDSGVRYGVNLFAPQTPLEITAEISAFHQQLQRDYAVADQLPNLDYSNGWQDKLDAVVSADNPPTVVSSTFGCFSSAEISRLHEAGIEAWVTVTSIEDALSAQDAGADALVVQGPAAGGHRGTWSVEEQPSGLGLVDLIETMSLAGVNAQLVASGGVRTADDARELLKLPRVKAVSCGSAFLLADEAGTSEFNRTLLQVGGASVATRAFSGRVARGLETEFIREHHDDVPAMYPLLNSLLAPLRQENDPRVAYCLVGEDVDKIGQGSVADILAQLRG